MNWVTIPKMNKVLRVVGITLPVVLVLHGLVSWMNSTSPNDPKVRGGDSKQITGSSDPKHIQSVTLERPIGNWGTKFVVVLQVEGDNATLTKGYVEGSTGGNFAGADQALAFGISSPEFWLEKQPLDSAKPGQQVFSVFVNFKRVVLLIFGEQVTSRVGDLIVVKPTQAGPSAVSSPQPPASGAN